MAKFIIDGEPHDFDVGESVFKFGSSEILSDKNTDISYHQKWYHRGFETFQFLNNSEFELLSEGISRCISSLIGRLGIDVSNFKLERYHHYIRDDDMHHKIAGMTRDLFLEDFDFPILDLIDKLGKIVGLQLTDINSDSGKRTHIIVRINRPNSSDFNPPHKDIYESFDSNFVIPKFVNFWVPICGVSSKSMLPVVPGSHLLSEDKIFRTFVGGIVNNNKYRVRSILSWDGKNEMYRPPIKYGEVLVFTPHLIHGCAINSQENITRVALEYRLFKK